MRIAKKLTLIAVTVALQHFSLASAQAQTLNTESERLGIGLMLGEPSGISVKYWTTGVTAFNVGVAWSLSGRGDSEALHTHADFLWHAWFADPQNLAFYYGLGGRVIFATDARAGVRVPFGLNYVFETIPFDLFVEAVPILDLTPDVAFAGNGAVGIRYYF